MPDRTPYQRVKPDFGAGEANTGGDDVGAPDVGALRGSAILLTLLLCVIQAVITVTAINTVSLYPNSTLIPVVGFGMVFLLIATINPLTVMIFRGRVKPLNRVELMSMFAALMVTAGVSTFGLSQVLVPLIPAPWNPEWDVPQRGWDELLHPYLRHELFIQDVDAIRDYRQGIGEVPPDTAPLAAHVRHYRDVIGAIPWTLWLKPLAFWMFFIVGCYGLFWSLAYLMIDQWSKREKLIFPLAKLPEALLPETSSDATPAIFRSGLFWTGFLFAFLVMAYNAAARADVIPLESIPLGMSTGAFGLIVNESIFGGLTGGVAWLIIFTCIGIAFLLPLEISFSVWFYFWIGRLTILFLVWSGRGRNFLDFPSDWTWVQNPVAAQGMGAMLLFSAVIAWRGLRGYLQSLAGEPRKGIRLLPLVGFGVSVIIVAGWIHWNHLPWLATIAVVMFLILLTVGLTRIVAETGMYWHQIDAGFFHLYKMLAPTKVIATTVMAPLILIYSILFFDIKTFIAPNIVNAAKMQRDVSGSRWRFHLNIVLSLIAAVVVSIGYSIVLAYTRGAQHMNGWFYARAPLRYCEAAARATTMPFSFEPATFTWCAGGAVWVALSMYLRQTLFWFPHPIGYLMNVNPLMQYLWFSFFIGWLIKKIVVKYGGKQTFDLVRLLMLGLIFGELLIIFLAGLVTLLPMDIAISGIDLNRYRP